MNKKLIKQTLLVFALMIGAIAFFSMIPVAGAQLITTGDIPGNIAGPTGSEGSLRALVLRIVNYFLAFLGLIAVIMVIYGGITYVTAAGKDEPIQNAKKIIMYALIGLIIILLSFALVNTVLQAGTAG